ncbi:hypothetical protein PR048_009432, partial [Dryococelus australis]
MEENNKWELVDKPPNMNVINSKWISTDKSGKECIKKARLIVRGFLQKECDEGVIFTSSLNGDHTVAAYKWKDYYLHIKCAFLNGVLDDPVYMKVPKGVDCTQTNIVCKLLKSLYGLRHLGFQRSKADPCLYFCKGTYILICVDDILVISDKDLDKIKNKLMNKNFEFLGLEIEFTPEGICQQKLLAKVLSKFNMIDCKTFSLPMEQNLRLVENKDSMYDYFPYKQLLRSVMYLMLSTRLNIIYFRIHDFTHWKCLKQILKYLKHTKYLKLCYKSVQCDHMIEAYVGASYASDLNRSVSDYTIKHLNNDVLRQSKKQNIVPISSSEAEYISLSFCVTECLLFTQLSGMLNALVLPIVVYEDNQSAIKIASTLEKKRSKYIDMRYNFLRELVKNNKIKLMYTQSDDQVGDMFTKAL